MPYQEYLLALAREGAIDGVVVVSTSQLAKDLGTSQQTVSRSLIRLEQEQLIERKPTYRGIQVRLTDKAVSQLEKRWKELNAIFRPAPRLRGIIKDGLGEGAWYIRQYAQRLSGILGYTPFFGTLNLEVDEGLFRRFLRQKHKRRIPEFSKEGRVYGAVDLYPAEIRINNKREPCSILVIERTRHPAGIIEVVARACIREKYHLKKNDEVLLY